MSQLADILQRIVDQRQRRVDDWLRTVGQGAGEDRGNRESGADFLAAIRNAAPRAVIAEVKMGSPRLGSLQGRVDPEKQARRYAASGAAAISVVVEPDFFYGDYELLARCRQAAGLPVLAKDFVVHPIQLQWAREAGASAVLLIAALVSSAELLDLASTARRLGLTPLVECHSRADIQRLGEGAWELVGINNRDLRTFEVDLEHSISLLPSLPAAAIKVAESGIATAEDVTRLAAAGFDAFLIGETLLKAEDPAGKLGELIGEEKR